MSIFSKLIRLFEPIGVAHAISQMKLEGQRDAAIRLYNLHKEDKLNG